MLAATFVNLGETPLANSYLTEIQLTEPEPRFPLHARVCQGCLLVQLDAVAGPADIFSDYAYFSSYSDSWVDHARTFCEMARRRFNLDHTSQVIEVASNDGYLLRHFVDASIPVLGIEPAANVAEAAKAVGISTETTFFGLDTAEALLSRGIVADLLVANNVLAHVPDINDFVAGLAIVVKSEGVISLEFPHILHLIDQVQYDTIYHEHFSYFSFSSAESLLSRHGLRIFDVEELPSHGGSLRLFACHDGASHPDGDAVRRLRDKERAFGLDLLSTYTNFGQKVQHAQCSFRLFLAKARAAGESIVAYGAAAKGNTLLNSTGTSSDDISFVVDRSPHKQGRYLPGSRIPVRPPEAVHEARPDILLILAWNLREEVIQQMGFVRDWGCRFVVPIPYVRTVT